MTDRDFENRLYELGQSTVETVAPPDIQLPHPKQKHRRGRTILLIAACVALLSAAALAASMGWGEKLINHLGAGSQAMESVGGAMGAPLATAETGGLTVTVRQTLADRHCLYLICELELPKDVALPENACWGDILMSVSDESKYVGPTVFGCSGFENDGGKITCVFSGDSSRSIETGNTASARLELTDFGYWQENDDGGRFVPVASGFWELKWDYTFEDLTKEYPAQINGHPVTVELSPISAWTHVDGEKANYYAPHLVFTDGTVMDASKMQLSVSPEFSGSTDVIVDAADIVSGKVSITGGVAGYPFNKIIDLSTVKSVLVHGTEIPVG